MNILLYSEALLFIKHSGVGRAIVHQKKALDLHDINHTSKLSDFGQCDIVHINTIGIQSFLLAKFAKHNGRKVVIHAHSTEEDFKNSFIFSNHIAPLFKYILRKIYNTGDLIITPTKYSKHLLQTYNLSPPIVNVSNGIDLTHFNRRQFQHMKANFRATYGFASDEKIILSVGLQIKRKGILDFIELAKQLPEYTFAWCGTTPKALMTHEVKKAIKSAPSNVHFLGYVHNMLSAYCESDLFLMPTYEETEGIVILEALACRLPIIVRDIPVYADWLEDSIHCKKASTNKDFKKYIRDYFSGALTIHLDQAYLIAKERSLNNVGHSLHAIYSDLLNEVNHETHTN
jgi:1,2-diacylglycerol-3-alpha-glucose alpha-1,2-glucosyltransferase